MKKSIIVTSLAIILIFSIVYVLNELSKSRTFQFYGGLISQVETDNKVVALTFDDGPAENTDEILETLRSHNVQATFYLTGYEIETNRGAAEKIVQEGHEIGNHTYSHPRMVFKTPGFIEDEIKKTDELIREIGYVGEITFRPPYGKRLILLPRYLSREDRKTVLWNIEPETYPEIATDSDKIVEHVIENIEPGSIILLHVMYESREESLKSVDGIITSLHEQGYSFVSVSELLELEK